MNDKISIYALSKMSKLVYEEDDIYPPEGWEEYGNSREFNKEASGQFAIVYKKKDSNTFVIANRGTRFKKIIDWKNDRQIVIYGESDSAKEALKYFEKIYKNLKDNIGDDFKIYTTGHSKGAFESSYITKKIIDNKQSHFFPNYSGSIGFNGPGFGAFRKIETPSQYPHINFNRESDVVSVRLMKQIGVKLAVPDKALKTGVMSNHSITHVSDLFASYKRLGELEINKQKILSITQADISTAILRSRIEHIKFLQEAPIPRLAKINLLKSVHGIRNHALSNSLVKEYIKNKKPL